MITMDRFSYTYRSLARRYKDTIRLLSDLPTIDRPVERIGQEIIELEEYYRKVRRDYRLSHRRRESLITTGFIGGVLSILILWAKPPTFIAILSAIGLGVFLKCIYDGLNVRVERLTSTQQQNIHEFVTIISKNMMRYQGYDDPKIHSTTIYDIEQLIQYIENQLDKGIIYP